jgi:hypothetical protein
MTASWRQLAPSEGPEAGHVVVVGALRLHPPIEMHGDAPKFGVLPPKDHVYAMFTHDLSESFDRSRRVPLSRYESAWLPAKGWFFLDLPDARPVYLRGFLHTDGLTGSATELPVWIQVTRKDRVVYIGEINLVRTPPVRVTVNSDVNLARRASAETGRQTLLQLPWTVRPADPGEP